MIMGMLAGVVCFFFSNVCFGQTLLFKYTSEIDFNPAAVIQYGQALYLGPSFVGLRIHSYENDSFNPVNNKSRLVILDLKGNKKWTWNAYSFGVAEFYVEPSPSGSFWIRGIRDPDPIGKLFIYDKKGKTWLESSIGQDESVDFLAMGAPNITSGLCTVTKNESGFLTFYVYKY
jgi:hypothetical protein